MGRPQDIHPKREWNRVGRDGGVWKRRQKEVINRPKKCQKSQERIGWDERGWGTDSSEIEEESVEFPLFLSQSGIVSNDVTCSYPSKVPLLRNARIPPSAPPPRLPVTVEVRLAASCNNGVVGVHGREQTRRPSWLEEGGATTTRKSNSVLERNNRWREVVDQLPPYKPLPTPVIPAPTVIVPIPTFITPLGAKQHPYGLYTPLSLPVPR